MSKVIVDMMASATRLPKLELQARSLADAKTLLESAGVRPAETLPIATLFAGVGGYPGIPVVASERVPLDEMWIVVDGQVVDRVRFRSDA